jgi:hypothetical protein
MGVCFPSKAKFDYSCIGASYPGRERVFLITRTSCFLSMLGIFIFSFIARDFEDKIRFFSHWGMVLTFLTQFSFILIMLKRRSCSNVKKEEAGRCLGIALVLYEISICMEMLIALIYWIFLYHMVLQCELVIIIYSRLSHSVPLLSLLADLFVSRARFLKIHVLFPFFASVLWGVMDLLITTRTEYDETYYLLKWNDSNKSIYIPIVSLLIIVISFFIIRAIGECKQNRIRKKTSPVYYI